LHRNVIAIGPILGESTLLPRVKMPA